MRLLCVLVLWAPTLALSRVCQQEPPTVALLDELRFCRELDYAFCVQQERLDPVIVAELDLPDDISDLYATAPTEVSAAAVVVDRHLAALYTATVRSALGRTLTQGCLDAWRMAMCSEAFSHARNAVGVLVCPDTCDEMRRLCSAELVVDSCARQAPSSDTACQDFSLSARQSCVVPAPAPAQPNPQPVQPNPQPVQPNPQPVQPNPQPVQPKPATRAPTPRPVKPVASSSSSCKATFCVELFLVLLTLEAFSFGVSMGTGGARRSCDFKGRPSRQRPK